MLVLLPLVALGMCVLALKTRVASWREAMLAGAVIFGGVLVSITELCSALHALTPEALTVGWALVGVVGAVVVARRRACTHLTLALVPPDRTSLLLVGPLAAVVLALGAIAVLSPPNTWDSMTYHMARVGHWQQDASLAPYPTHVPRQLYLQPAAEFVLLHLQLLSGGDHLAGLVQWASMLGALIGTALIAEALGARHHGALSAVVFAASLPIGVLESTSTQNDYVVAFWLVCLVMFALRIVRPGTQRTAWAAALGLGASLGLALLSKATAYLVAVPFLVWVIICLWRRFGSGSVKSLAFIGGIALALNAGFYARNLMVFSSPVGPLDEGSPSMRYVNDSLTPPLVLSNLLRDLALNLVATPVTAVNVQALNFVETLHSWSGVEIADPRTTWAGEIFTAQPPGLAFDENFAGNPVHLLLILAAITAAWSLRRMRSPALTWYAAALAGGFLLFAACLRWQPWHTRLELPFFILGGPIVGTVVERIGARLAVILPAVLLAGVVPWVMYNQARPLVGPRSILITSRDDQYFTNRPGARAAYIGAIAFVRDARCNRVGFVSDKAGWEYPFMALPAKSVEIQHVGVTNVTANFAQAGIDQLQPCALVSLAPYADVGSIVLAGQRYETRFASGDGADAVAVLTPSI